MADHARDETLDSRPDDDGLVKSSAPYARSELSTPPEIATGTLIGNRYEVIRRLGEGGMGAVYEAEHTAIQRRVAVKVLHPEFGRNPSVVERFLQEARAVNAVRHRNVVEVMDFGVDHGRPWLVMELLAGESLAARVERTGAGDPAWAVRVLDPICRALSQAHQRGFLHRDVKPDNVFLVREDDGAEVPKLLDFGIAKNLLEDRKLTATGAMVGTPAYMAPEQITDPRAVTQACDQYAVGAMAYEMLTARLPHEAETFHGLVVGKVQGECVPITDRRADLPPALAAAVMRSLRLDPSERYPDIESFRLALHASLAVGQTAEQPTASLPPPSLPPVVAAAPVIATAPVVAEPPAPTVQPSAPARSRLWIAVPLVLLAAVALLLGLSHRAPTATPVVAPPRPVALTPPPPVVATPPAPVVTPPPLAPVVTPPPTPVAVAAPVPEASPPVRHRREPPSRPGPRPGRLQIDSHNPLR